MIQKSDYHSLKPKSWGRLSPSLAAKALSCLLCFGAQLAMANTTSNYEGTNAVVTVQSTVTGTVIDSDGAPLPGANVLVKGTTNGTQTDFDGNFSIQVEPGATLVFSYIGFIKQEVAVGSKTEIIVTMLEDAAQLSEVIVTGYSTETKRETTGAISTVKAEDIAAIPSANIEQSLQGRVAGITVITNGQPGSTSQIRIRGFGAFGGNEPLYIVDGVPVTSTDFLNPADIDNTTVLKDAAAASIYGARAANGVVVYTTKQGARAKQKTEMTLTINSGVTDPNVGGAPDMLNPQDMADWTFQAYRNNAAATGTPVQYTHPQYGPGPNPRFPDYLYADGASGVVGSVDMAKIQADYERDPLNTFLIKPNLHGTNWYKEITHVAPLNRISLNFNGGTEAGRFFIGLGAQSQDGVTIGNSFTRYTIRANSEWDLRPWLAIGENFQATYRSAKGIEGGEGGIGVADDESTLLSAFRMPTIIPVRDEFGSYASTKAAGFNNPRNPVRVLDYDRGNDTNFNINLFGNMYLLLKPIDGLTLRSSLGMQYNSYYYTDYNYKYLGDSEPQASDSFSEGSGYNFQWVFTNTATYEKLFGVHKVKVLGGMEALNTGNGRNISGSGINPFSMDTDYVTLNNVDSPQVNSGLYSGVNFYSLFGKLDYNFDERYYVTGVVRRDGSSRFGSNNRYGIFPAASVAWRVIAESFMQNQKVFSDLKFRAGWGQMGNSNNVNPNNQYSLYASSKNATYYPIQGQATGADPGYAQSRIGNPDAKWETSETLNIGFDASFFNNHLDLILDWWNKDTKDLLYTIQLPGVVGTWAASPAVNIATMNNHGVDFQIVGRGNFTEDFSFEVTLNNSFLSNEITYLTPGLDFFDAGNYRGISPTNRNAVGHSLSSFFGYKVMGYFNSQAEVDSAPAQDGKGLGRFRYEDVNGDGVITPDDRTFLGSPVPAYTGGLTLNLKYKQLEFETYWYGSFGNDVWNQQKWFTDFFGSFEGAAKGVAAFKSWTPELGNNAAAPIWESASNLSTNGAGNSWYVEDATFVRLQRISLSYDFDTPFTDRLNVKGLKMGVAANNLWTITNYSGIDPSVGGGADTNFGVDVGNYPATPSFTIDLELKF